MRQTAMLLWLGLVLAWPASVGAGERPNVLVMLSDDQRFDTIRALGNGEIETPALDRLVKEGFAFTRAHIMGAQQGAVCVPSRAMLMTGRSLFRATTGLQAGALPARAALLPAVFRQAGYDTFGIGKWHNDRPSFNRAFAGGENIFFGGMSAHERLPVFAYDPSGAYRPSQVRTSEVFSTVLLADAAVRYLQRRSNGSPFFLYVAFTSPHDPRTPPPEFASRYDPARIKLPANFLSAHPFDNGELKVRDEQLLPWPRTPQAVQREIALYYAMVTHLDRQVGRILQTLDERGLRDDTLVVFAGDNGLAVGQHGLLGKQSLYDHSVRVPLIFRGPGVPAGRRSEALCYLLDVLPTLCDLARLPVPDGVDGLSLAPILQGRADRSRDTLFAAYRDVQRMVRDDRWKVIWYPKINRWQLFDLADDPAERLDLSDQTAHADALVRLKRELLRWQQQVGDPLLK